jgi:hypothetical protein
MNRYEDAPKSVGGVAANSAYEKYSFISLISPPRSFDQKAILDFKLTILEYSSVEGAQRTLFLATNFSRWN